MDFWYGKYQFSIEGESSIMLSELFEKLGIEDVTVADVANVTFTDESLVKVEKTGENWKLMSLKAFDTEEKLTIEMNNGQMIEVRVTDAEVHSENDANFKVTMNGQTKYYTELSDISTFYATSPANTNAMEVEVLRNCTVDTVFNSQRGRPITFKSTPGQKYTITLGSGVTSAVFNMTAGAANLTVQDLTIDASNSSGTVLNRTASASTTFTNVVVTAGSSSSDLIKDTSTGNLSFENCVINGSSTGSTSSLVAKSGSGAITISETTINANNSKGFLLNSGSGKLSFTDSEIKGADSATSNSLVVKSGTGEMTFVRTTIEGKNSTGDLITRSAAGIIEFTGGSITGPTIESNGAFIKDTTAAGAAGIRIDGTTFSRGQTMATLIQKRASAGTTDGNDSYIKNVTYVDNATSAVNGGFFSMTATGTAKVTVDNVTYEANKARGAFLSISGSAYAPTISITGLTLTGPTEVATGSLVVNATGGAMTISGAQIYRGSTTGAVIYSPKGKLTINGSSIISGAKGASDSSSVVAVSPLVQQGTGDLALANVKVTGNDTSLDGVCAVDASKCKVTIGGTVDISDNTTVGEPANVKVSSSVGNVFFDTLSASSSVGLTTANGDGQQFGTLSYRANTGYNTVFNDQDTALEVEIRSNTQMWWGRYVKLSTSKFYIVESATKTSYYDTLEDAVAKANILGTAVIYSLVDEYTVEGTCEATGTVTIQPGSGIQKLTLKRGSFDEALLVSKGTSLTLNNVIIDGLERASVTGSLVKATTGKLILNNVEVKDHTSCKEEVYAVNASGSAVTISGEIKITGNTAKDGARANLSASEAITASTAWTGAIGIGGGMSCLNVTFMTLPANNSSYGTLTNDNYENNGQAVTVSQSGKNLSWSGNEPYVCQLYKNASGPSTATKYTTLKKAFDAINFTDPCTIEMIVPVHYLPDTPRVYNVEAGVGSRDITLTTADSVGSNCIIYKGKCNNNFFRILGDNHSLTLKNITLDGENVNSNALGALIHTHNLGHVNMLEGCILQNGYTGGHCGGIDANGGNIYMNGAIIRDCYSTTHSGAIHIHNANGDVILENILIENCGSQQQGGAIYVEKAATFTGVIRNCSTTGQGGAIYLNSGSITIGEDADISNCSGSEGGAIYIAEGTVNIEETGFIEDCHATKGNGGAVYMKTGTLNLKDTGYIQGCRSNADGGAVYLKEGTINIQDNAKIKNCSASGSGGAIDITAGTLNLEGGVISGCLSETGAVYVEALENTLINVSGSPKVIDNGSRNIDLTAITDTDETFNNLINASGMMENAEVGLFITNAYHDDGGEEFGKTVQTASNSGLMGFINDINKPFVGWPVDAGNAGDVYWAMPISVQAKVYCDGVATDLADSSGKFAPNKDKGNSIDTVDVSGLATAYGKVNAAVDTVNTDNQHSYLYAKIGETMISSLSYNEYTGTWKYTPVGGTAVDYDKTTPVTLYYVVNPRTIPYHILLNENGSMTEQSSWASSGASWTATDFSVDMNGVNVAAAYPETKTVSNKTYRLSKVIYAENTPISSSDGTEVAWLVNTQDGIEARNTLDGTAVGTLSGASAVYIIYSAGYDLTVTKTVGGAMGDPTKNFTVEVESSALSEESYKDSDGGDHAVADHKITLTIKDGQSITLKELPEGDYTVTETPTGESYQVKYEYQVGTGTKTEDNHFTLSDDTTVDITNTLGEIAPTGVSPTSWAFLLILLAGAVIGIGTLLLRRKRSGQR